MCVAKETQAPFASLSWEAALSRLFSWHGPVGTETFGMLISGCLAVPYFKTRICEQFRIKL